MANEFYHVPGATGDPAEGISTKAYSANYLKALYDKFGAWKHIRNFTADVSSYGESVTIPSFPRLTASDISMSDGTYTANDTAITPQTVTINKPKAVGFKVPRMVYMQAKLDVQSAFAAAAADAVHNSMEIEMVKLIPSITNTAGTLGSDLDEDKINAAVGKLVENHVPLTNPQDFVWILPASQYGAVKKLRGYDKYRIMAQQTDANGTRDVQADLETLAGFPLFFRNDSEMTVSGGKIGGLFYVDSVGIAIQRMPALEPPVRIPGSVNIELLTWAHFGIALIKKEVAVKILTK